MNLATINGSPVFIHRLPTRGNVTLRDKRPLHEQFAEALAAERDKWRQVDAALPAGVCACGQLYCAEEGRTACSTCEGGWQEARPTKGKEGKTFTCPYCEETGPLLRINQATCIRDACKKAHNLKNNSLPK